MRTSLKKGYIWELDKETGNVDLTYRYDSLMVEKAYVYSLSAFLLRVLRRRGVKNNAGKRTEKKI